MPTDKIFQPRRLPQNQHVVPASAGPHPPIALNHAKCARTRENHGKSTNQTREEPGNKAGKNREQPERSRENPGNSRVPTPLHKFQTFHIFHPQNPCNSTNSTYSTLASHPVPRVPPV